MWREIRLLASSNPVIASMTDVATSGGYYRAMAADIVVSENLTLTGSIGVITGQKQGQKGLLHIHGVSDLDNLSMLAIHRGNNGFFRAKITKRKWTNWNAK